MTMHNNSQNYVINQSRPQSPQWKKHNWKWRWEKTYVSCINIVTFILFYHNVIAKIKLFELSLNLKKMSYENWKLKNILFEPETWRTLCDIYEANLAPKFLFIPLSLDFIFFFTIHGYISCRGGGVE